MEAREGSEERGKVVSGMKGWKREDGRQTGQLPSRDTSYFLLGLGNIYRLWPWNHKEAGGAMSRGLGHSGSPCTCQRNGPGLRWSCMPGKVLSELPAHFYVLINHKMSPRGRIKLSVSLYLLPLFLPIHTAPCSLYSPSCLRP